MKAIWGERGFGQLDAIIMVSVLGVMTTVGGVMMTKFSGTGDAEAGGADLYNVQTAVIMMMRDNGLETILSPVEIPTRDMTAFPDSTTLRPPGLSGYRLFSHDKDMDGVGDAYYVNKETANWWYVVDKHGMVTQVKVAPTPQPGF